MSSSSAPSCASLSLPDQLNLIENLQVFNVHGRDKLGRKVLRIVGKFFPARLVSNEALNKYLEEKVFPKLGEKPFSVVYFHAEVQNMPGISVFRSIYEAFPNDIKDNLEALHFIHPGIQARLFLATFGRFLFNRGLYKKLNYVTRLDFLWDYVRKSEIEIPEYVNDHDEELEYRPILDYGIESDHPGGLPMLDSAPLVYSMRSIA